MTTCRPEGHRKWPQQMTFLVPIGQLRIWIDLFQAKWIGPQQISLVHILLVDDKATRVLQEQEKFINVVKGAPKNNGRATNFRAGQIFKLEYGQFVESWFPGNNYMCKCGSSGWGSWEGLGILCCGMVIYIHLYLVWCL